MQAFLFLRGARGEHAEADQWKLCGSAAGLRRLPAFSLYIADAKRRVRWTHKRPLMWFLDKLFFPTAQRHERQRRLRLFWWTIVVGIIFAAITVGLLILAYGDKKLWR